MSIRELCADLWPALPWLPRVPGENNARCTPFRWVIDPTHVDGRRVWEASCADWLWCKLEALVGRGKLEHAPAGEVGTVDGVATVRYRVTRGQVLVRAGSAGVAAHAGAAP